MTIPLRFRIRHDDYHAQYMGSLPDGRQFLLTMPFFSKTSADDGEEFVALYVLSDRGRLLESTIESFGPRASLDHDARVAARERLLASLGELTYCDIVVQPFEVMHDGKVFGFVGREPDEPGTAPWIYLVPGDYMALTEPWDGLYDA